MSRLGWLESALDAAREGQSAPVTLHAARQALERGRAGEPLPLRDVALLLRDADPEREAALAAAAFEVREAVFGRRVGLFAPLYYSNVCSNDCVYCGFRRSLGTARRRVLEPAEIAGEARALTQQGHGRILLIASEDPTPHGWELALAAADGIASVAPIRPGEWSTETEGLFLAAELAPRSPADFARLAARGVSAYVLFQETYDPALYPTVHPGGPKASFENRLAGLENAAAGGIARLGLGALFGLGEPALETVALVAHARHLEMLTGRPAGSVSAPRLEPADDVPFTLAPPRPVSDREWLRILAVLRLALPQSDLIVSTRESIEMRRAALGVGATVFSAGSRTDPGGYSGTGSSRGQFRVGDERSLGEVAADLRASGFEPTAGNEGVTRAV